MNPGQSWGADTGWRPHGDTARAGALEVERKHHRKVQFRLDESSDEVGASEAVVGSETASAEAALTDPWNTEVDKENKPRKRLPKRRRKSERRALKRTPETLVTPARLGKGPEEPQSAKRPKLGGDDYQKYLEEAKTERGNATWLQDTLAAVGALL